MSNIHKFVPSNQNHGIVSLEYADETERLSVIDFIASDKNRVALQQSDDSLWFISEVSSGLATWIKLAPITLADIGVSRYDFTQSIASDNWVINHNLNRHVSVKVYTTGGIEFIATIQEMSLTQVQIFTQTAIAGYAVVT
jgi:hypothetical protein